ncbi:DnaJ domain-containing protein [Arthrobacter sp. LAPM80]|uniref:J domain-containing protein n=1 Tax=Arthrobacter sp. LAPM80 TaxID=3141788 RepID=UPI00398BA8D6
MTGGRGQHGCVRGGREKAGSDLRCLPDFYAVLHLGTQASAGDIRRAYRSLLRQHHPDTRPASSAPGEAAAEAELLQGIMDPHAVLGDPARRALYDQCHQPPDTAPSQPHNPGPPCGSGQPHGAGQGRPGALPGWPPIMVGHLRWEPPTRRCS